jgi:hypothetical protein
VSRRRSPIDYLPAARRLGLQPLMMDPIAAHDDLLLDCPQCRSVGVRARCSIRRVDRLGVEARCTPCELAGDDTSSILRHLDDVHAPPGDPLEDAIIGMFDALWALHRLEEAA